MAAFGKGKTVLTAKRVRGKDHLPHDAPGGGKSTDTPLAAADKRL